MAKDDYDDGRRAYRASPNNVKNPHAVGTPEYNDFERGWVQQLKRADIRSIHDIKPSLVSSEPNTDEREEERKRAAQAYAKATGR